MNGFRNVPLYVPFTYMIINFTRFVNTSQRFHGNCPFSPNMFCTFHHLNFPKFCDCRRAVCISRMHGPAGPADGSGFRLYSTIFARNAVRPARAVRARRRRSIRRRFRSAAAVLRRSCAPVFGRRFRPAPPRLPAEFRKFCTKPLFSTKSALLFPAKCYIIAG